MIEILLFISILLQVTAAILAFRLIRITESKTIWVLMTIGLVLMAAGRIIDILPFFSIEITHGVNRINEWVDVFISIVMVAGMALIQQLFSTIRKSENALRENEEKYRSLISTADPIYMIDRNFKYMFINEKELSRFSLPLDKIIGKSYGEFHSPETTNEFMKIVERVCESSIPIHDEYRSKKDNHFFLRTVSPVKNHDGTATIGVTVVSRDITYRKQIEEKLIESEQRLHNVIQSSPIPAFVIGQDHKILYWNKALEELTRVKAEKMIGTTQNWRPFYSSERPSMADLLVDQALDAIPQWYSDKYIKSGLIEEAYEATDFFPELQAGGKWLRLTAAVIRDSQGNPVGAMETLEDVTERKRAEEQLIMVKKLESLWIFADGIAHDFNSLLSIMLRNIFAANLSLADEQHGLWREGLEIAESAGLQAKELAHRLVTFAKGGEPIRKIGSISKLLMDSVDLSLSGSNVVCEFSLPGDLWLIEMDDVQIRQVIHNLLVNAREAMPEGGAIFIDAENVNVTARCGLPLEEGNYVKWSIKDQGPGISQENLQRIMDPYFTTKPAATARGTGLGLAICNSIVKRHDGFISVESELGVGSTFFVYLPASSHGDSVKKAKTDQGDITGMRILLMNDDETVRDAAGIVLNYLGYDVEYAKDGREAIDLYRIAKEKGWAFSAVILDLIVPGGMGGEEAIRELLAIDSDIVAVVSSGDPYDPVVSEFWKYGFAGAVDVPYDLEKIKKILNDLQRTNLLNTAAPSG